MDSKKIMVILALIDTLYPNQKIMVSKKDECIAVGTKDDKALILPFEKILNMKWKDINEILIKECLEN